MNNSLKQPSPHITLPQTDAATRRLRIAFVVESGTDFRLLDGFAERFDVEVIARKIEGGVEVSQTPSRPVGLMIAPSSRRKFARCVMQFIAARIDRLDAIIVQGYGLAALAANLSARKSGIPVYMLVCSPVEAYYRCRKKDPQSGKAYRWHEAALLRILARWNARFGQHYIVLSRHLAETVLRHGAGQAVHIVPVYGVDTDIFRPADISKLEMRKARSLPLEGSLLFFSSRIAPEKDADTLLEALRLLRERSWEIRVLHRSGGFQAFLQRATHFGVEKFVISTSAVHPTKELPLDYQACDLCVQASREEGLGFSVLESLACGTPVVAARVGGLKETIIEGETGWSYTPGDPKDLARSIEDALASPEEAQLRTMRGRELVLKHFETGSTFDQLAKILGSEARPLRR